MIIESNKVLGDNSNESSKTNTTGRVIIETVCPLVLLVAMCIDLV